MTLLTLLFKTHILRKKLWVCMPVDDGTVHVYPLRDQVIHIADEDCICGPTTEAVSADDGSYGWTVTHHSLDGREHHE